MSKALITFETEPTVKLICGQLNVTLPQSDAQLDIEVRAAIVKSLIDNRYKAHTLKINICFIICRII